LFSKLSRTYKGLQGFSGGFCGECGQKRGQILTINNFLVINIVDDNALKGTKAHANLQFNR
jgi:hypothetical protein